MPPRGRPRRGGGGGRRRPRRNPQRPQQRRQHPHASAVRTQPIGLGRTIRPAVVGLGALGALGGAAVAAHYVGEAAGSIGAAVNPPLQDVPIDTNGDGVPDSTALFDRKTGLTNIFGTPPSSTQENDRQEVEKLTAWLVAGGAVAVVALVMWGRSK